MYEYVCMYACVYYNKKTKGKEGREGGWEGRGKGEGNETHKNK